MKRAIVLPVLFGILAWWNAAALAITPEAKDKVLTAASKNLIEIGLSYRGDQITFFGINPVPGSDLIIKLTAAKEEDIKLSLKGRVGPLWMTVKQYDVSGSPFIYKLHATKPIDKILSPELAKELELGYEAIRSKMKMHLARGDAAPDDADKVFKGILKIKEEANLYNIVTDPKRLEVAEGKLFKHYFRFPAAATEGKYQVESYAVQNGQLVGYGRDVIEIKKVGVENWLTQTSQSHPAFFGFLSVIIAAGTGLGVGLIFGKGGHH